MDLKEERLPHLDAARFLAFLPIFIHHFVNQLPWPETWKTHLSLGIIGLDFFFVLSGFILSIRYLFAGSSIEPYKMAGYYLCRRIGRTWPMYILWCLLSFVVNNLNLTHAYTGGLIHWLSFSLNFELMESTAVFWFPAGVLWSICVEEQFYLFLTLLIFFPRFTPYAGILMIIASVLFRANATENTLYYHPLSYAGNFGLGILLPFLPAKIKKILSSNNLAMSAMVALFIIMIRYPEWFQKGVSLISERMIFSVLFSLLIFNLSFNEQPILKPGSSFWMTELGKRSLGLYLFQSISIVVSTKWIGTEDFQSGLLSLLSSLAITFSCTWISFSFFENPINRKVKNIFSSTFIGR